MKQCSKCGVVKPYEHFSKNKSNKDGYQYACKKCESIHHKMRRNSNIEYHRGKIAEYKRKWNVSNGIGVYGLWNKIEQCWDYVGEGGLNDRHMTHKNGCNNGTPWEVRLNVWFDGFDNIYEFRVLCKCENKQQCKEMETYYIHNLNPRYNKNKRQHKTKA